MSALLAALAVPGPPQQLILGHLSLQERLYLSATCTALQAASQRWHWDVFVLIGSRYNSLVGGTRKRNIDLAALNTWLQRHPGCDLRVGLFGGSQVQPLLPALSPLPTAMIVQLNAADPFTWHGISTLTRLRHLRLSLRQGLQGIEALEYLASLTRLTALTVFAQEATAADLVPLWLFTQLQHLSLYDVKLQALLSALHALPSLPLRQLGMRACTEAGLVALLPAVRAVTSLYCHFNYPPSPEAEWPQQLQLLTQLQELHLRNSQLAAVPASLPRTLTALSICFQRVPLMELHPLTRLYQLRSLVIMGGMYLHGGMQAALEGLPPLPELLDLNLSFCALRAVPASVAALAALTMLRLTSNRIQSGWEHLEPLTRLRELQIEVHRRAEWLEDDQFLHAIPPAFSCLTALTRLSLAGQGRIQRGWQHLQPLSQLQCLDLQKAQLARMLRGLTALWELPVRIEVEAHGAANSWVQRFNARTASLIEQHRQLHECAYAWLRFLWLVLVRLLRRLLRRLFGRAATE